MCGSKTCDINNSQTHNKRYNRSIWLHPILFSQFLLGLATSLATDLLKAGAGFLKLKLFKSPLRKRPTCHLDPDLLYPFSLDLEPSIPFRACHLLRHFINTPRLLTSSLPSPYACTSLIWKDCASGSYLPIPITTRLLF